MVENRTSAPVRRSSSTPSASGAYISSSKPRTSTRPPRAPRGSASAIPSAMPGSAASRAARWAGVKPCRPPSGTPAGQPSATRVTGPGSARGRGIAAPSCSATSAWPFSRTPSGSRTVPEAVATRSTRAPISRAKSSSRPWSSGERMSTRATMTYRPRGKPSCRARIVFRTVLPVENSSSTRTSGPSPESSRGSSGSSRCEVACEWDSSKPPARSTPSTGRRVECR